MTTRNAGRRFVRAAALAAVAAAAGGCALPINGRTQRVAVTSTPPHARVLLDGSPPDASTFRDAPPPAAVLRPRAAHVY